MARDEAEKERTRAEGEELRAYHALLENYHATAESNLAQARHFHNKKDVPGARDDALAMLSKAGSIWEQATSVLRKLGSRGQHIEDGERRVWSDRLIQLRYEAARWLSQPRLDHIQTLRLPVESSPYCVALSRDGELVAVGQSPGQILLLGKDGVIRKCIDVPRSSARAGPSRSHNAPIVAFSPAADKMAVACPVDDEVSSVLVLTKEGKVVKRLKLPEPTRYSFPGTWDYVQLAFPETNVIEFEGYVLNVVTGEVRGEPVNPNARMHSTVPAVCAEYKAALAGEQSINVRRLADGATVLVQIPAGDSKSSIGEPSSSRENKWLMQFGNDCRSLFVSRNATLALIDARTGAKSIRTLAPSSSSPLRSTRTPDAGPLIPLVTTIERLIPLDNGVAVVAQSKDAARKENLELSFWRTRLPASHIASLPHPQSPNTLVSEGGMVVSGGNDHTLRAFRDGKLVWSSGTSLADSRRSYRWWDFMATGKQYLQVERLEIVPNRESRYVTELYTPAGQLARSFLGPLCYLDGRYVPNALSTEKGAIVAASADRRLAVVIDDVSDGRHALQLWSLCENKSIGNLGDHSTGSATVKFSPDNQWLVLRSADATEAQVWRLPTPTLVGTFAVARRATREFDIKFVSDRPWLLVLENEFFGSAVSAQLVDLQSATKICDLQDARGEYRSWSVVPATNELVGISRASHSSRQYRVTTWETETGKARQLVPPTVWSSSYGTSLVLLSPDGTRLLIAGQKEGDRFASRLPHVELWDLQKEAMLRSFTRKREQRGIHPTPFAHDGKWSESHDDEAVTLTLTPRHGTYPETVTERLYWKWSDGKEPETLSELDERSKSTLAQGENGDTWLIRNTDVGLVFESAPGESAVVLGETGGLVFPNRKTAPYGLGTLLPGRTQKDAVDVLPSPDGETLAMSLSTRVSNAEQRLTGIWNARTGERLTAFPEGARLRRFDPTGRWFGTSDAAGQVTVWDAHSGEPARTFQVPPVMDEFTIKIHPSGQHVAVQSKGILTLWDAEQGRQLATIGRPGHFTAVNCVSQHEKAGLVASGGNEGVILLWDRETGELRRSLLLDANSVTGLQFHPAGDRLAFVTPDRLVLTDLEGRQLWTLDGKRRGWRFPVFAFHPSGGFLAAGTEDGRVVFVDAQSGKLLGAHQADTTPITALGFSQDGKRMATGSEGKRIHLWDDGGGGPCAVWGDNSPITGVFFGDCETLATAGKDIRLWDVQSQGEILRLPVGKPPARLVCSGGDGYELMESDQTGVTQFDLSELERQFERLHLGRGEHAPALFTRTDSTVTHAWDEALKFYRDEIADESLQRLRAGEERLKNGEPQEAVSQFTQAIALNDQNWQAWHGRAKAYSQTEKWSQATSDLAAALELNEDDWRLHYERGDVCMKTRKWDEAIDEFTAVLQREGKHRESYFGRAVAWGNLGEWAKAEHDYSQAIELQDDDWHAWEGRAEAYANLAQWERAADDFQTTIKWLGKTQGTGDLNKVLNLHYRRALTTLAVGDSAKYADACGSMLQRFGETEEANTAGAIVTAYALGPGATRDYTPCLKLAEEFTEELGRATGGLLYRAGKYEEARTKLQNWLDSYWRRRQKSLETGSTTRVTGRTRVVQTLTTTIVADPTRYVPDMLYLAMTLHQLGEAEEARRWLENAEGDIKRKQEAIADYRGRLQPWYLRLRVELLHTEAKTLIGEPETR